MKPASAVASWGLREGNGQHAIAKHRLLLPGAGLAGDGDRTFERGEVLTGHTFDAMGQQHTGWIGHKLGAKGGIHPGFGNELGPGGNVRFRIGGNEVGGGHGD